MDKNKIDKSYSDIIENIKNDVTKTQLDILINANVNLVNLYYRLGKILSENSKWGNKFIDNVAMDLKISFPNAREFVSCID